MLLKDRVTSVLRVVECELLTPRGLRTLHRTIRITLAVTLIDTPTGAKVPIGQVAEVREDQGPNTINRENVQRRIIIQANVAERDLGSVSEECAARWSKGAVTTRLFTRRLHYFVWHRNSKRHHADQSLLAFDERRRRELP